VEAQRPIEVIGSLDISVALPTEDSIRALLAQNPELVALKARVHAREAELRVSKALGRPEPTVGLGYRRLHDDADNAIVVGVSLPLPFFDRNQGNVQAQSARIDEAESALLAAELRLNGLARSVRTQIESRAVEIAALEARVLPATQQALEEIDAAYRLGRQPYLNVLDAQRSLAEIQLRLVEAKVGRVQASAQLESLTGHRLTGLGR
jgi:cobalt-zinc-cadmium efflux system outer membrane protein